MNKDFIYSTLEAPLVYKLSQFVFAPGSDYFLTKRLKALSYKINNNPNQKILDVGCGPSSWLWKINCHPYGLDILHKYSIAFQNQSRHAITGSALQLPFANNSFSVVFSLGVLHHLDDQSASQTIQEMIRVCKIDGSLILLDAILPQKKWCRPLASLIRRLDKGSHMRTQANFELLLKKHNHWQTQRYTYAATGLEMLECIFNKTK